MTSKATLPSLLRDRAAAEPDRVGYLFLEDGIHVTRSVTWGELHANAVDLARVLLGRGATDQPVLLTLPSGIEYVEALFACWYANAIAVPVSLPRHSRTQHRLDGILADVNAKIALCTARTRRLIDGAAASGVVSWIDVTETRSAAASRVADSVECPDLQRIAVLQYTSGSTGSPRGVMVSHENLIHNSAIIADACGHDAQTTIGGWLPLFHDMGLVGINQAAFTGARCVFMPPERFLMRPWNWLKMISDYQVRSSPAPNFAYDLCVEKVNDEQKASLDLRCWKNALNGSEPIRAATLERFSSAFSKCGFKKEAHFPCYGLAESTLMVTAKATGSIAMVNGNVGCGRPVGSMEIAIVDPETMRRISGNSVGEIWLAGESCAAGYWNNPVATAHTFGAKLVGEPITEKSRHWLRTGDLGFISEGELFITGRLRELIIIAGRNLFPIDVERTVEAAEAKVAPSGVAAFSTKVDGVERLIIAAELRREVARSLALDDLDLTALKRTIRAAVAMEHEVTPADVVILCPGGLPRTTSGKINRLQAEREYRATTLSYFQSKSHEHINT